ncbi:hypothetical protein [Luteolibacter sp. AS25]
MPALKVKKGEYFLGDPVDQRKYFKETNRDLDAHGERGMSVKQ